MPGLPQEVLVQPDGARAYVSCLGKVAVIDLASWTVTHEIQAGTGADGLGWAQ